jgi:DNA-binding transcriptional ArsR family regulator
MKTSSMNISSAVQALSALAQEQRLNIFRALVQAGSEGINAGRMSEMIGTSPSALSFHLKSMLEAKLISYEQKGRFLIYQANFAVMNELLVFLSENCCQGMTCDAEQVNLCKL